MLNNSIVVVAVDCVSSQGSLKALTGNTFNTSNGRNRSKINARTNPELSLDVLPTISSVNLIIRKIIGDLSMNHSKLTVIEFAFSRLLKVILL